jgi:hypothetical protein
MAKLGGWKEKKMIDLTPEEIKALIRCLKYEIDANNRVLSMCNFSDEEDLEHWHYINDYNKKLKSAKQKFKEYLLENKEKNKEVEDGI